MIVGIWPLFTVWGIRTPRARISVPWTSGIPASRTSWALTLPGVPVACVNNLDNYGLLPGVSEQRQRSRILQWFAHMYSPAVGSGAVMDYLGQTGLDTLQGADILKDAPKL